MDKSTYLKIIERIEKQFKFAIAIRASCNSIEENYAEYFEAFSYGPHLCKYEDLYLEPEDEKVACATLEHSTTYIIATQLAR